MTSKTFDLLEDYVNKCLSFIGTTRGQGYCVGKGMDDFSKLKKVENELNLTFSAEYKNFLKHYGEASIEGHDIFGFGEPSMHGKNCNVVERTKFYKETQKWPGIDDWYIVSDDGRGNPIGIDPEGKVWLSDHDAGFEKVKLADNFEEFLYKLLTDTLYQ